MLFRCKQLLRPAPKASVTFCIAHFNSPEFLDAILHSIRLEFFGITRIDGAQIEKRDIRHMVKVRELFGLDSLRPQRQKAHLW